MAQLPITFTCALPEAELLFGSITASQGLSTLDEIELNLLSPRSDLRAEDLLGKPVSVKLSLLDGAERYVNGYVTRFGIGAPQGRHHGYHASVRPWLWFLTRTVDCRIFQDLSAPDIVRKVFEDHGAIAKFKFKLNRSYRQRVYCVQYRESDFNFVTRLLEDEGIYWYFEHTAQGQELVLVDDVSALPPLAGEGTLPYYDEVAKVPPGIEYISSWSFSREVQTGSVALTSFDFERPQTSLLVDAAQPRSHDLADLELFDFGGDYTQTAHGRQLAENRIDEAQSRHERLSGKTNTQAMVAGAVFTLTRHPRDDQNTRYVCLQSRLSAQIQGRESGETTGDMQCSFSAIPATQVFRPPRRTPKPFVQGPQTAMVVGPGGEEIFTDNHGRVKVQFHWDRYGHKNEKSSCWIRVSQPWAGKGWGGVSIPRIGQEVVIDFLEGDPDQPLVTGRVYNGESPAPFGLPAGAVLSGIKSKTHKGSGYNELSMDDTAGKEMVTIHAQYNMGTTVLHDQTTTVNNDQTNTILHDQTTTVTNDQTNTVQHDQTTTVTNDQTSTVNNNQSNTVQNAKTNTVNHSFTETIKSDTRITVSEGTYNHDVAANTATYHVQGALTETYDATQSTTVKDKLTITSTAGAIAVTSSAQHVDVTAATTIQIQVGASMIKMGADGTIEISGVNIAIHGSANVTVKGGTVHSEADSEHQTKGAIVLSEGAATNTVKGGMVMLNP
ncbi:MAG: type VI secretion system tip protein VgrG [Pseudomonadota bacterium]|nr:type VI secretion system tip protein VgrG [Pseudomonadota bacterium]